MRKILAVLGLLLTSYSVTALGQDSHRQNRDIWLDEIGRYEAQEVRDDRVVHSPVAGIVVATGTSRICPTGTSAQTATVKFVTLEAANGLSFKVLGVDQIYTERGARVSTSDAIGLSKTGSGQNTNLYFEVRAYGGRILSSPAICSEK